MNAFRRKYDVLEYDLKALIFRCISSNCLVSQLSNILVNRNITILNKNKQLIFCLFLTLLTNGRFISFMSP